LIKYFVQIGWCLPFNPICVSRIIIIVREFNKNGQCMYTITGSKILASYAIGITDRSKAIARGAVKIIFLGRK